ncbi:hypothetical protein MSG28_002855 [Choristoneura fumiferana]|uniref:Uncharacterized protein n=1 Tax=Choristoneura fumiferana TaxID=7141 RepID=A0ACC0JJJ4_CHOFU|nr:hypothetical protein MSG28_002855 [Choristoneura fumiferana]
MESTWAMQVSYYNISRAVWEPLIEPVEILKDYTYKHVPWELKMERDKSEYYGAPYVLHNCTGLTAKLLLEDNHDFTIVELEEEVQVPVERADKRYFPLGRKQSGSVDRHAPHVFLHESRGLISDVVMQEAALHIYLRSVVQVEKNSSAPLWPIVEKEEKLLLLRVLGSSDVSAPFLYTEQHTTIVKRKRYGGLYVEVQLSEGGTYITVRQYRDGHAPALVVNYCPYTITVYEKENINVK